MRFRAAGTVLASAVLGACGTTQPDGTLAELEAVPADVEDVYLEDSLERAARSYRDYLNETPKSALTPEAMRRLADLQLEREYGVIGTSKPREIAADESGEPLALETHRTVSIADMFEAPAGGAKSARPDSGETDLEFEQRATDMTESLADGGYGDSLTPGGVQQSIPTGPLEALATYRQILETYPNYERNDQVLYQMSRAHDELGQTDEAVEVMARLVREYPYSKYVDEVRFRRGEYYFVRKKYLDAEDEYSAIIAMGSTSSYYELALYKLGWTLYKQEFYEQALNNFLAMLDYKLSTGYDFDIDYDAGDEEGDEHRVADTFRVISLSFSNLGGADTVNQYFAEHGQRSYADKIYSNLAEFYFAKLRYEDASSVYRSFIDRNPLHKAAPHFSMRVIEIYDEAAFPKLVVESKKRFATDYAVDAPYWLHHDIDAADEVVGFLKTNLTDLANHYHALFQEDALVDERPDSFREASRWYRQFLASFPEDPETPPINYQLADLLLENEDFNAAAKEYERTAYGYAPHEKASAAGYAAVYSWREDLKIATGDRRVDVQQATVESSLRFADTFQDHEQAPVVLGAAADDLYEMKDYLRAIESAQKLIDRYPVTEPELLLSAWAVIAHSSIDIAEYRNAELAYLQVLALTPADDESRPAVIDGLAASIYKQGEEANAIEDYRAAAENFLRIRDVAPTSAIRTAAEYDAAAALMKLEDWGMAADVLEGFRSEFPEHELNRDATKQLAFIYREDGQLERSAAEHVRIADESEDPQLAGEALLVAGELYDEAANVVEAIAVFERYVEEHPRPLDLALETRNRLAGLFKSQSDYVRYHEQLGQIVAADRGAGAERTDRSRYLASKAALVLAELSYERFAELELRQPFDESLAEKQTRMDAALADFEALVDYEVAEVTAAATFYIAEIYFNFSGSLVASERPAGLSEQEKVDYELVIEEEAYPFEEQAIEVHEENFELLVSAGIYNDWVQKSLDKLAVLMPGRYAKDELSAGYVGSIDTYAYRMPIAPSLDLENTDTAEAPKTSAVEGSLPEDTQNLAQGPAEQP
jgi:tetratricopeptide (TPR) repeat protein